MIIKFNQYIKENKQFDFYLKQINDLNGWLPITNKLYNLIEQEGWVEELTFDISDEEYNKIRNNIKNKFTYKKLQLLDSDKNGLINNENSSLEFFNELDMLLKNEQEYLYNTLDFIDYDNGIVYIIKYNNS